MSADRERLIKRLAAARGDVPADLVIRNGLLVNVLSGAVEREDVAVFDGVVIGFGSYEARETVDAAGKYIAPSFWDGHMHLESSMLTPVEFARAAVPAGTGAIVIDPHEIANVMGLDGVRYILNTSERLPLDVYCMAPSCVPASGLETSGADLPAEALAILRNHPRVLGLAEVMNFPGVINGDEPVLDKILEYHGGPVDGHAPLVTGKALNAYLSAGIHSDHECARLEEAREKLARGMRIMIRQGTQARNLTDLLPLVTPVNSRRIMLVTDDRSAEELLAHGHMNDVLRQAVAAGLDPVLAVQMVTINTAEYFGFRDRGAVAPGFKADLVIIDDLERFNAHAVVKSGKVIAREGAFTEDVEPVNARDLPSSVRVKHIDEDMFHIPARGAVIRAIELVPDQLITNEARVAAVVREGMAVAVADANLSKIAVIERHHATGNVSVGFVKGLGLREGALCSSVAHDSHNLIVTGMNDRDMFTAARAVADMGGGLAVVNGGLIIASLSLPIAGLMSDRSAGETARLRKEVLRAAASLGCTGRDPFMALSFLALPVIPSLKITDRGLVDVNAFAFTGLFVE